jgi:hypothetical protein
MLNYLFGVLKEFLSFYAQKLNKFLPLSLSKVEKKKTLPKIVSKSE